MSECCQAPITQYFDDTVMKVMYTCTTCHKACGVIEGVAPKVSIQQMNVPIYRAYDVEKKTYVQGFLDTGNNFMTFVENKNATLRHIQIELFTGKMTEEGTPVYDHDIVEIAEQNEFGSATLDKGVVLYSVEHMAYVIGSMNFKDRDMPLPTKILRVIGQQHD